MNNLNLGYILLIQNQYKLYLGNYKKKLYSSIIVRSIVQNLNIKSSTIERYGKKRRKFTFIKKNR